MSERLTRRQRDLIEMDYYGQLAALLYAARHHLDGHPWCLTPQIKYHKLYEKLEELEKAVRDIKYPASQRTYKRFKLDD